MKGAIQEVVDKMMQYRAYQLQNKSRAGEIVKQNRNKEEDYTIKVFPQCPWCRREIQSIHEHCGIGKA